MSNVPQQSRLSQIQGQLRQLIAEGGIPADVSASQELPPDVVHRVTRLIEQINDIEQETEDSMSMGYIPPSLRQWARGTGGAGQRPALAGPPPPPMPPVPPGPPPPVPPGPPPPVPPGDAGGGVPNPPNLPVRSPGAIVSVNIPILPPPLPPFLRPVDTSREDGRRREGDRQFGYGLHEFSNSLQMALDSRNIDSPSRMLGGLAEGGGRMASLLGVGAAGVAGSAVSTVFGVVTALKDFGKALKDSNLKLADWSASMMNVKVQSEMRNILLDMERGERRAKSAAAFTYEYDTFMAKRKKGWDEVLVGANTIGASGLQAYDKAIDLLGMPGEFIGRFFATGDPGEAFKGMVDYWFDKWGSEEAARKKAAENEANFEKELNDLAQEWWKGHGRPKNLEG